MEAVVRGHIHKTKAFHGFMIRNNDISINKGVFMDSRKGLSDRFIKPGHFMDLF